jgi:hypothetical protein
MCGIVGILGEHEAAPILIDALKRLEYRVMTVQALQPLTRVNLAVVVQLGSL